MIILFKTSLKKYIILSSIIWEVSYPEILYFMLNNKFEF